MIALAYVGLAVTLVGVMLWYFGSWPREVRARRPGRVVLAMFVTGIGAGLSIATILMSVGLVR